MLLTKQTETQRALSAYQEAAKRLDELRRQAAEAQAQATAAESAAADAAGTASFEELIEQSARARVRAKALEAAATKAQAALTAARDEIVTAWIADAEREVATVEEDVRRRVAELRKLLDKVARVLGTDQLPVSILFQPRYAAWVEDDILRSEPAFDAFRFECEMDRLLERRRALRQQIELLRASPTARQEFAQRLIVQASTPEAIPAA